MPAHNAWEWKEIRVHLLAFYEANKAPVRGVNIPAHTPESEVLGQVWHWGQNDHQPLPMPSVSMGDVIIMDTPNGDTFHLIKATGFEEMTREEYEAYLELTQRQRMIVFFRD